MMSPTTDADARTWWAAADWARLTPCVLAWARAALPSSARLAADDVDDLVAITMMKCWRYAGVPDHPAAFVRTVAWNQMRIFFRSPHHDGRTQAIPMDSHHQLPSADPAPDAWIEQEHTADTVYRIAVLLERLPKVDRQLLQWCDSDGLTIAAAAVRLGISYTAAKMRIQRARAKLATLLRRDDARRRVNRRR